MFSVALEAFDANLGDGYYSNYFQFTVNECLEHRNVASARYPLAILFFVSLRQEYLFFIA